MVIWKTLCFLATVAILGGRGWCHLLKPLKQNLSSMKHHFGQHHAILFIHKINTDLSSYSLDPQRNQEVHIHHPAIHSYNHISGQPRYRYPVQYNFLSLVDPGHLHNLFHHSNCLEIRPKKILVFWPYIVFYMISEWLVFNITSSVILWHEQFVTFRWDNNDVYFGLYQHA